MNNRNKNIVEKNTPTRFEKTATKANTSIPHGTTASALGITSTDTSARMNAGAASKTRLVILREGFNYSDDKSPNIFSTVDCLAENKIVKKES